MIHPHMRITRSMEKKQYLYPSLTVISLAMSLSPHDYLLLVNFLNIKFILYNAPY